MKNAVLFKVAQRKYQFRNPHALIQLPDDFTYTSEEYRSAEEYINGLAVHGIAYCYPGHIDYPSAFLVMKEPPLFLEYSGPPVWKATQFISVVGSRDVFQITEQWLKSELEPFIKESDVGVVSGGARGVDQLAHFIAIKNKRPTVFILPSGLLHMYPHSLREIKEKYQSHPICFVSEFEIQHELSKSHFYFRNRLIAALGKITLVAQASLRSGSLLTVHHCLEMGRPVLTIPAHPEMHGFAGNLKLLYDGADLIRNTKDLHDFWMAESWPN